MKPDDVIGGKYRVDRVIGGGGMGVVVAARHLTLDTPVAIKVLQAGATTDPNATQRFEREARIVARLHTQHVARVLDFGTLESGEPYLVMEQLFGQDLGSLVASGRRLSPTEAVDHVLGACDAIAEAHALGVVHRDLKPGNLFLADQPDGTTLVKVLDFGISKAGAAKQSDVKQADGAITSPNDVFGSPMYMSPEQLQSATAVDRRTDVWALGVILYELLAGAPPYGTGTVAEIWNAILSHPVPPFPAARDVPAELALVVEKCLQKSPGERFNTVGALAGALAPYSSGSVEALRCADRARRFDTGRHSLVSLTDEVALARTKNAETLAPSHHSRRSQSGGGLRAAALVGLVLLGAGGLLWWRQAPSTAVQPTADRPVQTVTVVKTVFAAPTASEHAPEPAVTPAGSATATPTPVSAATSAPKAPVPKPRDAKPPKRGRDPFATPD